MATKPIMDTDKTFKLIYASNLCPDSRHPFFEMTLPDPDADLAVRKEGNFYIGQTGVLIHRVTLRDAYEAGHVLFNDVGEPLTYEQFVAAPGNKLGRKISYDLDHEQGGSAAIDLMALLTAQKRGARECVFAFVDSQREWRHALEQLRDVLGDGPVGIGFDVATTTKEKSNPSALCVMERRGGEYVQRLVVCWKEKRAAVASESVDPLPAGYETATNFKTYLGDCYSAAVNENRMTLPGDGYLKADHQLWVKNAGRYECEPDNEGRHGDTADAGKLALFALSGYGGGIATLEDVAAIRCGDNGGPFDNWNRPAFTPRSLF